jgi:hypothetical protein
MSIDEMRRLVISRATGVDDLLLLVADKLHTMEVEMESLNNDLGTSHRKYEALRKAFVQQGARLKAADDLAGVIALRQQLDFNDSPDIVAAMERYYAALKEE